MRAALFAVALIGCGRLGFDERAGGAAPDGPDDDAGVTRCQAASIAGLSTATVGYLDVAKLPTGYALGFIEAPQGILYGVPLGPQLVPGVTTPFMTSTSAYTNVAMTWTGANLLAGLSEPTGNSYLKRLEPDMTTYTVYSEVPGATAKPAFAAAGAQWFGGVATTTTATLFPMDATGAVELPGIVLGNATAIDAMSLASSGAFAAALWSAADGCRLSVVDPARSMVTTALGFACNGARLAGGTVLHFVYETAGGIAYRTVAVGPTKVPLPDPERILAPGTAPQIITIGDVPYAGWTTDRIHVARVTTSGLDEILISGLPAGAPSAWQLVDLGGEPGVVAVFGASLYAVDRCQ